MAKKPAKPARKSPAKPKSRKPAAKKPAGAKARPASKKAKPKAAARPAGKPQVSGCPGERMRSCEQRMAKAPLFLPTIKRILKNRWIRLLK